MAWAPFTSFCSCLLFVFFFGLGSRICYGFRFGFDIYHRFSDPVKGFLGLDDLPEKGSLDYYVVMAYRDRLIRARHLAASYGQSSLLTFANGNDTFFTGSLGFLHYANVSVGTPSLSFLVALDTGSNLFWLPCDCKRGGCVTGLRTSSGEEIKLNIYSPNNSSTSEKLSSDSTLCRPSDQCSSASSNCCYKIVYLSSNTSSTGILVEDVLHLVTDDDQSKAVDARITFGCGQIQTGTFLMGAAPNGLFGLGMQDISVPSILAKNRLASNSFALCFGLDGVGRINFGFNGSSDQSETPFNVRQSHPSYNISITRITVGSNSSELEFSAIFDSGTAFTHLSDPAYTFISESFNSKVEEKRNSPDLVIPFEYCYELRANQSTFKIPSMNLTMKGGDDYFVKHPTALIPTPEGRYLYCLALLKSEDINIIGQNFMSGYHIVFDREKMILGWKDSNCYNDESSNTLAISPSPSSAVSPVRPVIPVTTEGNANNSHMPAAAPSSYSPNLKSFTYTVTILLLSFFAIFRSFFLFCYNDENSNILPTTPSHSPAVSPALASNPEAKQGSGNNSPIPVANHSPKWKSFTCTLTILLVSY